MGKGQLLFKGDKTKKKKKKSKHSKKEEDSTSKSSASIVVGGSDEVPSTTATAIPKKSQQQQQGEPIAPTMKKGTGKITTSGTVVTGHGTKFLKEVNAGDAIMCQVNTGSSNGGAAVREELRVITMRLSDQSLNLSSGFSESLKHPTSFQYIRKPRDVQKERQEALKKEKESKQSLQQHAFDLYSAGALVYREKTETGSYRIKRQDVEGANTRGDLLQLRAKKTSDKYC